MTRLDALVSERLAVVKTYKLFINGAFPRSESGRSLSVHDPRGQVIANIARASRKDLRDAVEAARAAQPKWAALTAYHRGQVLYRMAEMLEGKRSEMIEALAARCETSNNSNRLAASRQASAGARGGRPRGPRGSESRATSSRATRARAAAELDAAIDRLIAFAGWADKFAQMLGCQNAVAGPYYNFSVPEPTGIVGIVAPPDVNQPALLSFISLLAPPLCAGNAIISLASEANPLPGALLGEVCATSDVPPGVVNILTGQLDELLKPLAEHREVNAINAANLDAAQTRLLKLGTADNLKRVRVASIGPREWFDPRACESPWTIEPFVEIKTIWHPAAM